MGSSSCAGAEVEAVEDDMVEGEVGEGHLFAVGECLYSVCGDVVKRDRGDTTLDLDWKQFYICHVTFRILSRPLVR